jgi:hypothetical protein
MARAFLDLVQQAMDEIGIPQPTAIIGQVDDQSRQILALANREGKDFSSMANSRGGWQNLHEEHTFTTVTSQANYALPSNFEYFVQRSHWDSNMLWELMGPISAQEKQLLRYGTVASGPRKKFYVRGNEIYLVPTPETTGETIAFDYYSNAWCSSAGGADQTRWLADTDTYKLDDDCFIQGMKWRFLRAKGLDYAQEKYDYDADCMRVLARDGGVRDLPLARRSVGLGMGGVPDTGFGGDSGSSGSGSLGGFSSGFSGGFG